MALQVSLPDPHLEPSLPVDLADRSGRLGVGLIVLFAYFVTWGRRSGGQGEERGSMEREGVKCT